MNDDKLENRVIATCYRNKDLHPDLTEDSFFEDRNKRIFRAFQGGYFEPCSISLQKYNYDIEFLYSLGGNGDYGLGTLERDIETLNELKMRREIIKEYSDIIAKAGDLMTDIKDLPIQDTASKWSYTNDELAEHSHSEWLKTKPLKTGLKDLDSKIINFNRGEVWYMAGRTGTKKTSLAMQVLKGITASEGSKGVFFSLEMAELQFSKRMAEMYFYHCHPMVWENNEQSEAIHQCHKFLENNKTIELFKRSGATYQICFQPALTIDKIALWIRKYRKQFGDISTIAIDYFQLMKGQGRDRRDVVSRLARDLKTLAKSENVRIIALSQTSRENGEGFDKVKLTDLKESGDIEESADIVTGQCKDSSDHRIMNLSVLKGRNGSIMGDITLGVNGVLFQDAHHSQTN